MTWNCTRLIGSLCALLILSATAMGGGWEHNFETALSRARASEQSLLIHFHADWCGPCRTMERNVLNTAEVLSVLATNLVGVKVESDARRDLTRRYGITALPSDVIIAPDGSVLYRSSGAASRSGYVAKLTRFARPSRLQTSAVATQSAPTRSVNVTQRNQFLLPTQTQQSPQTVTLHEQSVDAPSSRTFDAGFTQIDDVADLDPSLTTTVRDESGRRIGLNGYCPVALSTGSQWITGTTEFRYEYQRVSYFMSSAAQLKKFTMNPEKYIPHLHGCDPVALHDENRIRSGAIELGASYRERIYFFATERNRAAFLETPERFSAEQSVAAVPPGTASDG